MNVKLKDGDELTFEIPTYYDRAFTGKVGDGGLVYIQREGGIIHPIAVSNVEAYLERGYYKLLSPITNKYEKEKTLENNLNITQDIYFDVAKHAKAWGVAHEEASKIIQKEILSNGIYWRDGDDVVCNTRAEILFVRTKRGGCEMSFGQMYYEKKGAKEATLQASITYTLHIEQPKPQEELVELMGKQYSKADIEKALALLQPKEEA